MELITTPEPHLIPNYAGHCPQYIYRCADTYGTTTHKLLIDPCIRHSEDLILSTKNKDQYAVDRPTLREIDLIKAHEKTGDPVYRLPMIPGYEGFIPCLTSKIGNRVSVTATEAVAEFEKHMQNLRCEARKLKHRTAILEENAFNTSLGERSLTHQDYRMPLRAVRPEAEGIIRHKTASIPKAPPLPYSKNAPPHFREPDDPEKFMIKNYDGHMPFKFPLFGQANRPLTNSALCDFTNNYDHRRSAEWTPITNAGVGTSIASGPHFEIYVKNSGIIPNYAGHVPGFKYKCGKSFTKNTVDAKAFFNE